MNKVAEENAKIREERGALLLLERSINRISTWDIKALSSLKGSPFP
jgi:hypothetical protein